MGWLTFLNPTFLWGALAASIPVIIHLINRRRARVSVGPAERATISAPSAVSPASTR